MLPGPGAHAPAEGSPAEARAGTGAGWSAEARRGRCHPPQGAGPTAAVRGGPGSGDEKVRRAGASPRTPRLAGLPHPTGLDKSHRSGRARHPPYRHLRRPDVTGPGRKYRAGSGRVRGGATLPPDSIAPKHREQLGASVCPRFPWDPYQACTLQLQHDSLSSNLFI